MTDPEKIEQVVVLLESAIKFIQSMFKNSYTSTHLSKSKALVLMKEASRRLGDTGQKPDDFGLCEGCGCIVPLEADGNTEDCEKCSNEHREETLHDIDCITGRK